MDRVICMNCRHIFTPISRRSVTCHACGWSEEGGVEDTIMFLPLPPPPYRRQRNPNHPYNFPNTFLRVLGIESRGDALWGELVSRDRDAGFPRILKRYDTVRHGTLCKFTRGAKSIGPWTLVYEKFIDWGVYDPQVYYALYVREEEATRAREALRAHEEFRRWVVP